MDNERQGQASPTPGARLFVQLGKVGRWPLFGVHELASVKEAWEGRGMQLQVPTRGQQGAVKGRSCISRGGERGCHLCPVEVVHSQVGGNHPSPLAPKRCVQPVCFGNNPRTRLSFGAMLKTLHNKKRPENCVHTHPLGLDLGCYQIKAAQRSCCLAADGQGSLPAFQKFSFWESPKAV